MSVDSDRNTKGPRQAKVCQFDDSFVVNQEVLWFQVSVENSAAVTEVNALQDLVQVTLEAHQQTRQHEDNDSVS